jgi:hypothetical protein
VGFQDAELYRFEGTAHGTQLGQDIDAVLAFANHPLDTLKLPGGTIETWQFS